MKKLILFLFVLSSFTCSAQSFHLSGNLRDTSMKQPLPNALMLAVKFTDSTLIAHSRTNSEGVFQPIVLMPDTYLVIISHPLFNDRTYLLLPNPGDTVFSFKNIVLPPKSVQLNEVEVLAYRDKMYYKGDTLQFTADSFKLRQNASVEDLLKKLPGVRVDAAGKITIQGKEVDQVLVDGDEFFGSDPTIATRNLNANTVETIQVYDKKNENTEGGGDETVKVVNLKLKEDAKKGYFGKVSAAKDYQSYYENDLLLNKFKGNRKISLFGLYTNTPKQGFGWSDANQYGLDNENNYGNYDPETNSWSDWAQEATGVPQTLKGGFYYNDRLGKNTKINSDYTFKQNRLRARTETNTQYFLPDTSYLNKQDIQTNNLNTSHNFNMKFVQKIDSLTELTVKPRVTYSENEKKNYQNDGFISEENVLTRETNIQSFSKGKTTDANAMIKLVRNFGTKDRVLNVQYNPGYYNSETNSDLTTAFDYYQNQLPDSVLIQKREQLNKRIENNASISFTEPWSKKIKTEFSYGFLHHLNNSTRITRDFNGNAFDFINPQQTNDFKNTRMTHRVGAKFIFEVKKYRVILGTNYRNIFQENINLTTGRILHQSIPNILPFASFNYRINQGSNLSIFYNTRARQPDLQQMQPVQDNTDPNFIRTGNPDLKPEFSHNFSSNYYFYKGVSGIHFYSGANANIVSNEINEKSVFDSLGRAVTTPVNVNGNYSFGGWMGGAIPLLNRLFSINYNFNGNFNNNVSFVNEEINYTKHYVLNPGLSLEKEAEKYQVSVGANYSYNETRQTISLQSNQNYYSYQLHASAYVKLPKKIKITVDGNYTNNGNRTPGYNLNFFIMNASINRNFLKNENLIVSIEGFDVFNQNISNQRQVVTNRIIDTKTQIVRRYVMLRLVYKFNSQKQKNEEDDFND
jgi:hypothetical protein